MTLMDEYGPDDEAPRVVTELLAAAERQPTGWADHLRAGTDRLMQHTAVSAFSDEPKAAVLPYADVVTGQSSGWSGSDASRDRAHTEDADGTTLDRQARVLAWLRARQVTGLTWRELADICGWHHGQASGALSDLHKAGLIARLVERRNRCSVYVLPEHVGGRATAAHGRNKPAAATVLTEDEAATVAQAKRLVASGIDVSAAVVKRLLAMQGRSAGSTLTSPEVDALARLVHRSRTPIPGLPRTVVAVEDADLDAILSVLDRVLT